MKLQSGSVGMLSFCVVSPQSLIFLIKPEVTCSYVFVGNELRQKIETEQSEIERLKQDIEELEEIRRDLYDTSSTSSSMHYSSEDSDDSDGEWREEELQDMMMALSRENAQYEVRGVSYEEVKKWR